MDAVEVVAASAFLGELALVVLYFCHPATASLSCSCHALKVPFLVYRGWGVRGAHDEVAASPVTQAWLAGIY